MPAFQDGLVPNVQVQDNKNKDRLKDQISVRLLPNDIEQYFAQNSTEIIQGTIQESEKDTTLQSIQDDSFEGVDPVTCAGRRSSFEDQFLEWDNACSAHPGETDPFSHDWKAMHYEYD